MRTIGLLLASLLTIVSFAVSNGQEGENAPPSKEPTQKTADKEQVGGEKKEGQAESESPSEETAPSETKEKQEPTEQISQQPNLPPSPAEQIKKRKKRPFEFKISAHGYASLQYQVGSTVQGTEQGATSLSLRKLRLVKGLQRLRLASS